MRRGIKNLIAGVLTVVISIILPLNLLSTNVDAADRTEIYTITGYNTSGNVKDSSGNTIQGHTYCLDHSKHTPDGNEYYRYRLSDAPGSIFDYETYEHATGFADTYVNEGKTFTAEDDAEVRLLILNLLAKQYTIDLQGETMQHIIWYMTCGKFCDSFYDDGSTMPEWMSTLKADLNSEPVYTFADYDAYFYYSINPDYQHTLGSLFVPVQTSFTIDKTVIDQFGDEEDYNGLDDTLGFKIDLRFYDSLGNRRAANENFTFTFTDRNGNTDTQVISTNDDGELSIYILSGQSVDVSGFEHTNYIISISEAADNTDESCEFDSMTVENATLSDNSDGTRSFDFSESNVVDIHITNRHIRIDPTQTTTQTSETTTAETSASVASTSETTSETASTSGETTSASVLGEERTSETTKAASDETTATPTPTAAASASGTVATGNTRTSCTSLTGIALIAAGAAIFAVRHARKNQPI